MWVSAAPGFLPRTSQEGKNEASGRHQQHMTLYESQATGCGSGPAVDARTWRRCRLVEAGFPTTLADAVATDPRFDLHALLQLVDRARPPDLAVRIMAPCPDEVAR